MQKTKLTKEEIKELEKRYGKHNFCYQCGNPNITPKGGVVCEYPKCGSTDLQG